MRKILLALSAGLFCTAAFAADLGELPLDQKLTVSKGDYYTFTPKDDGVLTIEFEGLYPENGILWSDLYNAGTNPDMAMVQLWPFSETTWQGPVSPAKFEIRMNQPSDISDAKVNYRIVGPEDSNNITITVSFADAGSIDAVEIVSLSQTPGGVFNFNESGTLSFGISPMVSNLTCGSMTVDMYTGDVLTKTINGLDRELYFESMAGGYYINLTNLWDYELKGTDIDSFVLTLSDFNYNMSGEYVNEEGNVVLSYLVDEFYGMIKVEGTPEWPSYFYPRGASPAKMTITYSEELNTNVKGEVAIVGAYLESLNSEAPGKTNVYEAAFTVSGNTLTIDFDDFTQTGPYNDNGMLMEADGYRTSGNEMSVIIRNFLGKDGSQVQPLLGHVAWKAEQGDDPEEDSVAALEADSHWTVYNLQGVKLADTDSFDTVLSLPSGLYIINGKKVCNR